MDLDYILQLITGIVTLASGVSAFVRDRSDRPWQEVLMSLVNMLALNFGRAANDKNRNYPSPG